MDPFSYKKQKNCHRNYISKTSTQVKAGDWKDYIGFKKMHGEIKDADSNAAEHWKNNMLPQILQDYDHENIFSTVETSLYYRAIPDGILAFITETISGSSKDRVTAYVTDKKRFWWSAIAKWKPPNIYGKKANLWNRKQTRTRGWHQKRFVMDKGFQQNLQWIGTRTVLLQLIFKCSKCGYFQLKKLKQLKQWWFVTQNCKYNFHTTFFY